jgi:hypothetical protein
MSNGAIGSETSLFFGRCLLELCLSNGILPPIEAEWEASNTFVHGRDEMDLPGKDRWQRPTTSCLLRLFNCFMRRPVMYVHGTVNMATVDRNRDYSQGALMTSLPFSAPASKSRRFFSACRCRFSSFSALRSLLASYLVRLACLRSSSFLVSASI